MERLKRLQVQEKHPQERSDIQGSRIPRGVADKITWRTVRVVGRVGKVIMWQKLLKGFSLTKTEGHVSDWEPVALKNVLPQTTRSVSLVTLATLFEIRRIYKRARRRGKEGFGFVCEDGQHGKRRTYETSAR